MAVINDEPVPICEHCFGDDHALMRKYTGNPNLEFTEGGGSFEELVEALAEKNTAKEH
jgi:hypothetical protein